MSKNLSATEVKIADGDATTIEFVGELTIRTTSSSHQSLAGTLGISRDVRVKIAQDAVVDLTFVQLLESARRTAREAGAGFGLAAPAAGQLRETLERGGFLAAPDDRDFWLMQSEDR